MTRTRSLANNACSLALAVVGLLGATGWTGCYAGTDEFAADDTQEVQSTEYPEARWYPASRYNQAAGRGGPVQFIVIHDTEGSYDGSVSWFRDSAANVSAHYVVRSSDGAVTQMVHDGDTAWHAGSAWLNARSIGVEHEGYMSNPGRWYTDEMYRSSARLVAHLAQKFSVPIDRDHIIGHYQIVRGGSTVCDGSRTYADCVAHNNNGHDDPGEGWDWDRYLGYVREFAAGATAPPAAGDCGAYASYAHYNCVPGTRDRARCVSGTLQRETCALDCSVQAVGQDDVCTPVSALGACGSEASYTHWNCLRDGKTMHKCGGSALLSITCSRGCSARPVGQDDVCN